MATRLTFTGDTAQPRVATLGDGSVLYLYRRADGGLYGRHRVGDAVGAETLLVWPCEAFDLEVGPTGLGVVFFSVDGTLRRFEVDPAVYPVLHEVTFARQAEWRTLHGFSAGEGVERQFTQVDIHAPTLTEENWAESAFLRLFVTLPDQALDMNQGLTTVQMWRRDSDALGWYRYATAEIPDGSTVLEFHVPHRSSADITWSATCLRASPAGESERSNSILDDGNLPVIYVEAPAWATGDGVATDYATVDRPINKANLFEPAPFAVGSPAATTYALTTYVVTKSYLPADPKPFATGDGVFLTWRLNSYDIFHP